MRILKGAHPYYATYIKRISIFVASPDTDYPDQMETPSPSEILEILSLATQLKCLRVHGDLHQSPFLQTMSSLRFPHLSALEIECGRQSDLDYGILFRFLNRHPEIKFAHLDMQTPLSFEVPWGSSLFPKLKRFDGSFSEMRCLAASSFLAAIRCSISATPELNQTNSRSVFIGELALLTKPFRNVKYFEYHPRYISWCLPLDGEIVKGVGQKFPALESLSGLEANEIFLVSYFSSVSSSEFDSSIRISWNPMSKT